MEDIKSQIDELWHDYKGRIRNPLIASFILVWVYLHWELIFKAFNDNPSWRIEEEICDLNQYINFYGAWGMVFKPILWAFASLGTYYIIAGLAQIIKVLIGERLTTVMVFWTDKGRKYVLKTKYDAERNKNKALGEQEEKVSTENAELKSKNRTLESEIIASNRLHEETTIKKDKELGEQRALNQEIHREKKELQGKYDISQAEIEKFSNDLRHNETKVKEYERDLAAKNNEIVKLKEQLSQYELSKLLWDEIQLNKEKSNFQLSKNDQVELRKLFEG